VQGEEPAVKADDDSVFDGRRILLPTNHAELLLLSSDEQPFGFSPGYIATKP
jgi:hypothetical protein